MSRIFFFSPAGEFSRISMLSFCWKRKSIPHCDQPSKTDKSMDTWDVNAQGCISIQQPTRWATWWLVTNFTKPDPLTSALEIIRLRVSITFQFRGLNHIFCYFSYNPSLLSERGSLDSQRRRVSTWLPRCNLLKVGTDLSGAFSTLSPLCDGCFLKLASGLWIYSVECMKQWKWEKNVRFWDFQNS